MTDVLDELVVHPLAWLLTIPAAIAGWFGLGPLLQFVVDTSGLWFSTAVVLGSRVLPEVGGVTVETGQTLVTVAAILFVTIQGGRLLRKGVNRLK